MSNRAHCEPLEHNWKVETFSGDVIANADIDMILRCKKCHASLTGKVMR
jgi:hypothetical protein